MLARFPGYIRWDLYLDEARWEEGECCVVRSLEEICAYLSCQKAGEVDCSCSDEVVPLPS